MFSPLVIWLSAKVFLRLTNMDYSITSQKKEQDNYSIPPGKKRLTSKKKIAILEKVLLTEV